MTALSLYLRSKGAIGDCPDWYDLFVAAHECNCTPWQMLEQSIWWREKAIKKHNAEAEARAYFAQHG